MAKIENEINLGNGLKLDLETFGKSIIDLGIIMPNFSANEIKGYGKAKETLKENGVKLSGHDEGLTNRRIFIMSMINGLGLKSGIAFKVWNNLDIENILKSINEDRETLLKSKVENAKIKAKELGMNPDKLSETEILNLIRIIEKATQKED